MSGSSSGEFTANFQGLAQIPQVLSDVKTGIAALKALISTPAAAAATGSPPATMAIGALGLELGYFLMETIEAIDKDIEGVTQNNTAYQATDAQVSQTATAGTRSVGAITTAVAPVLTTVGTSAR